MAPLIETLVHDLGPLGVALGAGLEGETAVVVGGALARHGAFNPLFAALGAWGGSFVADQLFFALGRTQREGRFVRRITARPAFARGLGLIERHPIAFCLLFRFVYGFRIAGPVSIGASQVPTRLFLGLNALSAAVWAAIFTAIGYRFGRAFERMLGLLLTPTHLAIAATIAIVAVAAFVTAKRRRIASAAEHVVDERAEGGEAG